MDKSEVRQAWEQSGAAANLAMQNAMVGGLGGGGSPSSSSTATEDKKSKKWKSSEIVEMQELMVDELRRATEAVQVAKRTSAKDLPWKGDLVVQMVQALASA